MSTAISFERVSKKFTLHHQRARSFQELALSLFRRDDTVSGLSEDGFREDFWALRDVSFTVEREEALEVVAAGSSRQDTAFASVQSGHLSNEWGESLRF